MGVLRRRPGGSRAGWRTSSAVQRSTDSLQYLSAIVLVFQLAVVGLCLAGTGLQHTAWRDLLDGHWRPLWARGPGADRNAATPMADVLTASRDRSFVGGLSLGYLHTVTVTFVGLWLTPYLLRHLDQHDYGLWLLTVQMLFYLALSDMGVVALLPREVAFTTGRAGETLE